MSRHRTRASPASVPREQRQECRHVVEFHGELRRAGATIPVAIVGLSNSGALVLIDEPPPVGEIAKLWIEDFGTVMVKVIHTDESSCGLMVIGSGESLDELLAWALDEPMKDA